MKPSAVLASESFDLATESVVRYEGGKKRQARTL